VRDRRVGVAAYHRVDRLLSRGTGHDRRQFFGNPVVADGRCRDIRFLQVPP
jgi:hypothetical protein